MDDCGVKLELRSRLVDSPASLGATLRLRRWERFTTLFPDIADMKILDVGGTAESWLRAPVRPAHVVVLNLTEERSGGELVPVFEEAAFKISYTLRF